MEENQTKGPALGRRDVLRAGAAFVAGGLAGGFLGRMGEGGYNTIFPQETQSEIDRRYLSSLFDIMDLPPSVYAGEGNILGRAIGIQDISAYLRFGSTTLVDFIANTLAIDRSVFTDNGDTSFEYKPDEQAIFLGSPVSNSASRYIMGYKHQVDLGIDVVPEIDYRNSEIKWSFLFGEDGFGIYEGQRLVAGRYSRSTSKLVHRPVYKLVDRHERKVLAPSITGGMLNNEWLTIIRRRDLNKFKTLIAGMHGTGSQAFFASFRDNIHKLYSLAEHADEYQIIVPVDLDHSAGLDGVNRTTGELDWSRARLHIIG